MSRTLTAVLSTEPVEVLKARHFYHIMVHVIETGGLEKLFELFSFDDVDQVAQYTDLGRMLADPMTK